MSPALLNEGDVGLVQILVLALVQGLTEFLPISSSAHLILVPVITGWPDQGVAFDVAVHVGTLAAVVVAFRHELAGVARGIGPLVGSGAISPELRLGLLAGLATIPIVLVALVGADAIEVHLRDPLVIATATVVFALVLLAVDRHGEGGRDWSTLSVRDALLIGLGQALALIPGTSRAGITITVALALGLNRASAARFSLFLGIPTIALAGLHQILELLEQPMPVDWLGLGLAALLAAVSAFVCIQLFLAFVARIGMLPFVLYRLALGALLYLLFWPSATAASV